MERPAIQPIPRPSVVLVVRVGETVRYATLADSPAARALREELGRDATMILRADAAGWTCDWPLPAEEGGAARAGDIVADGRRLLFCRDARQGAFASVAHMEPAHLASLFEGGLTVTLSLEWGE